MKKKAEFQKILKIVFLRPFLGKLPIAVEIRVLGPKISAPASAKWWIHQQTIDASEIAEGIAIFSDFQASD